MSTRSNIIFRSIDEGVAYNFYRHHDGYPLYQAGALFDLYHLLTVEETKYEFKVGRVPTGNRVTLKAFDNGGLMGKVFQHGIRRRIDPNSYESTGIGLEFEGISTDIDSLELLHGDIEYYYIVDIQDGECTWVQAFKVKTVADQDDWKWLKPSEITWSVIETKLWEGQLLSLAPYIENDTIADVPSDKRPTDEIEIDEYNCEWLMNLED